ncbi:LysR family transcriptional regulator [Vibrio sp. ZSDE26]|uniref:LysR family transcriptional regulator n=1 Tax=Vibrio amylolyticus TaxID=2847292 RepID=A0A9X1XKQ9_9VIBR|nr:LysR family transcriptional regulator [Vibrio amylolyticus]MCK6264511.1 LysR family transcriptional regulator [Vibrio amylolyticus]
MKDDEMLSLDFNSLKLLKVLDEERNTGLAADRLYLSQSAVSKALKRLREQLEDPLFERTGAGLIPTEKCQRLLNKLPNIISALDDLYSQKEEFTPGDYTGDISININTTLCRPLMTHLFLRLHELAPHATVSLENWSVKTETKIKQGTIDLAINYKSTELSKEISSVTTNYPEFRLCCHKNSPLTRLKSVSIEDVASYPFVLAIMPDHDFRGGTLISYFNKRGYEPNILLRSDKVDICLDTVRKVHSVMGVCEIVQSDLFDEVTLININHWEGIEHKPIACFVNYKFRETSYTRWLIDTVQEVIEELY